MRPLVGKELRGIASGRALPTMLLLMCPLVGYSFFQAVSLYSEAGAAAQQTPVLAKSLSPLDGILVPTFGAFYVAVTLLFPFVAIRVISYEKEFGALQLLVQLPYRLTTLVIAKLGAVLAAWVLAGVPVFSALLVWWMLGGHLSPAETANLVFGHMLYGALVGALALFAAAVSESAATAAIITLAFTIGSWVLDFTVVGRTGILDWVGRLSLTQALRSFEQGLLSAGLVIGMCAAIAGLVALTAVWLPPGVSLRHKLARSAACIVAAAVALALASRVTVVADVSEDQRNSFPLADRRTLAAMREPLVVTVHLAVEDPRYVDLRRNVLTKLERAMRSVSIRLAGTGQGFGTSAGDDAYGEVEYVYGTRSDKSRSTNPLEILPLLYGLAGIGPPALLPEAEYPGYPLVADAGAALFWFFGGLPLLTALAFWASRRPPSINLMKLHGGQS